ncbi:hypothetical protein [Niveibacterium terrae]|uniref:hypothetical protein n=1 Tax=Niveibacterium terrae TaxID=3373598 RepID=UPI003A932F6C
MCSEKLNFQELRGFAQRICVTDSVLCMSWLRYSTARDRYRVALIGVRNLAAPLVILAALGPKRVDRAKIKKAQSRRGR